MNGEVKKIWPVLKPSTFELSNFHRLQVLTDLGTEATRDLQASANVL